MTFKELISTEKFKAITKEKNLCPDLLSLFINSLGNEDAENLDSWEVVDQLDYDGSLHELIDGKIDIYYYDLRLWAVDNWQYVEEAIEEGLLEGVSDYHQMIQAGQYVYYKQETYQELENLVKEINELIEEMEEAAA